MNTNQIEDQYQNIIEILGSQNLSGIILMFVLFIIVILSSKYYSTKAVEAAKIDEKFNNIPKLSQIESAVVEAVKKVDYRYWQYQEIDQIRRIKIEKIFELLHDEMLLMCDAYAQITVKNNIIHNRRNILITILLEIYFPEIKDSISYYSRYCGNYQSIYTLATKDVSSGNSISSEISNSLEKAYEKFGEAYQQLHDNLISCASGLTYHDDKK